MDWKKHISLDNVLSALRNPSGRVTQVFFLCFLLSLLIFYVRVPIHSDSPPVPIAASLLTWFSSSSNGLLRPPLMSHANASETNTAVDVGKGESFGIGNDTGTSVQVKEQGRNTTASNLAKENEILGATHNESSSLLGGEDVSGGAMNRTVEKDEIFGGTHDKSVVSKEPVDSSKGTMELIRAESVGISIGGSNGSESYEHGSYEMCDIFDGKWVRDGRKPFYPPASCPYIDRGFNCHDNGRPDYDFLKWRWQPNRCNIPRMNAKDFLKRLRGQRLVFVGDSLNRNMWESMVCTLRQSVAKKKRVFEISRSTQFKVGKHYSVIFQDYNCSVEYIRAPFLVKQSYVRQRNGSMIYRIRLDTLEDSAYRFRDADIIVFNTANWWRHERAARGIQFYQVRNHVYPVLPLMDAYMKGLNTWARWVDTNINKEKTQVFFRSISLSHFSGGRWNSGGVCDNQTEPIFDESDLGMYPPMMFTVEKTLKTMRTPVTYLNVTKLTSYRKDGHPSVYRMKKYNSDGNQIAPLRIEDCSHWCLPGIPDAWNELLYASLLKIGRGSWRDRSKA